MRNILLTGSTGFVGSTFFTLYKDNTTIRTVSLRTTKCKDINFDSIEVVVHCAGIAHQKNVETKNFYAINRDLTIELATAAKRNGVSHFIFISTAKVYGEGGDNLEYLETSKCHPQDDYGKSKLEAEEGLLAIEDEKFTVSVIRPPLIYGANVKGNLKSIMKLARKEIPLPFKGVNNVRSMVFVKNLCAFIYKLVETSKNGIYNISGDQDLSTEMLVVEIREALGLKPQLFRIPYLAKKGLKYILPSIYERLFGSFILNCKSSLERTGFTYPYNSKQGIKEMVLAQNLAK